MQITLTLLSIGAYILVLFAIGIFSYRKNQSSQDFILGSRSLNFWLTALAAHASDMSSWLFMGYPAVIFTKGLFNAWIALGLILFMFLNWQFIAPKIRTVTEKYNSLTFSSFFESRFADSSGNIRIFTSIMSFVFYTIYISSGLMGLGLLMESLFSFNYYIGITLGIAIVVPYLFIGGYITLAWTDLFQGLFLMAVVLFVPIYMMINYVGDFSSILSIIQSKNLTTSLVPQTNLLTFIEIILIMTGWGLGYFGQPHILTKFMGIKNVQDMKKAKYVGMSWQIITLASATMIGLISIAYFKNGIEDPQLVFVNMVQAVFPAVLAAFILCAILAATISTMDSQILVLISTLAEDLYKRIFHKNATSQQMLLVSRLSIFFVSGLAYLIAFFKFSTIFSLVAYAWSGLGATFGPLLIFALYSKKTNKYGAWAGIISGGVVAGSWPYFNTFCSIDIPSILPGFIASSLAIWLISMLTSKKQEVSII